MTKRNPENGFEAVETRADNGPPIEFKILAYIFIIVAFLFHARYVYRVTHPQPVTAQDYHLLAKSLLAQARLVEAEKAAKKSIAINGSFHRPYMDLGVIYAERADYIKALKAFQSALEFVGNDPYDREIIYFDIGGMYYRERRPQEAWDYFTKAHQMKSYLGPKFWDDSKAKFLEYVKKNDKEGFLTALKNDTGLPEELFKRQRIDKDNLKFRYDEVIDDCQQFLQDNPGSRYEYVFLALMTTALLKKGEFAKATENLKALEHMQLTEDYAAWIKATYGYIYYSKGDNKNALFYLEDVLKNHPHYELIGYVRSLVEKIKQKDVRWQY